MSVPRSSGSRPSPALRRPRCRPRATAAPTAAPAAKNGDDPDEGKTALLVGYGPKAVSASRRPRKQAAPQVPVDGPELPLLPTIPDSVAKPVRHGGLEVGRAFERAAAAASAPVRAKPPVRRLARDLGVDLATIRATGPHGTVTRDDVQRAAEVATEPVPVPAPPAAVRVAVGPREERRPVKGVRKLTAEAMVSSAFTAPHVTEFMAVDVTRTMELVERLKKAREFDGLRVSPLLVVARAVLAAIRRHPDVNGVFDAAAGEIVIKHYVNLGIAAATPRGLIVPNVKDADAMTLPELCAALNRLVAVAKEGRTPAGGDGRWVDHDQQCRRVRRGRWYADHQPGRGGDPRDRRGQADAVGARRRGEGAAGHAAVAVLRPPDDRRRARVALPGRHRPCPGRPADAPALELVSCPYVRNASLLVLAASTGALRASGGQMVNRSWVSERTHLRIAGNLGG
ncbi:2-oxo acid dehydrogenase subunit E2 [Fodinicola feengrottensis]